MGTECVYIGEFGKGFGTFEKVDGWIFTASGSLFTSRGA